MIRMSDIVKQYRMGEETVHALDGVSLSVGQGEYVAVVGPSGSGKSTLMNIIGCLDVADSGSYALDGLEIEKYSQKQLALVRNEKIGFVFQGFNLLSRLNALENVELPLIYQRLGAKERKERALAALGRVGLENRVKHRPMELSGGQQQRVAIARALATQPAILLADEPTGNLDSATGRQIMQLFEELNKSGITIVLITHDAQVAARARRQIHIEDGRIVRDMVEGGAV
jgi:putative ABC transport system ATP-binding protein